MATASKDSGYVDNWQAGKTVTQCNLHMLTTEDCSDVIFRVGSEKQVVRAHRYVLVSRSCVFHAMFCGPLAEKGEVTIPDIDSEVFRDFLRYLYTDAVKITAENVAGLMYTSRKYGADGLLAECSAYLKKSLSEENVCQILEQCHGYGEQDLEQKALKILTEAGERVVKSPGFLDLCEGCLSKFLKSEQICVKEEDIFEFVVSWAKEKSKKENESDSPENIRKYLGEIIYDIRFTAFSQEYLVKVVASSGLLTSEERIRLMDRKIDPNADITPFKANVRKRSQGPMAEGMSKVSRYDSVFEEWCVEGKQEAISFSVSRKIQLTGCQLYGPVDIQESTYRMNIRLYDFENKMIAEPVPTTNRKLLGGKEHSLNDVVFPDPVSVLPGRIYTLCIVLAGKDTYYGRGGQTSLTVDGVMFTFRNSPMSTEGWTTCERGQIPGLIWKK